MKLLAGGEKLVGLKGPDRGGGGKIGVGGELLQRSALVCSNSFLLTENRVSSIQTRDKTNYYHWSRGLNLNSVVFHSTPLLIRGF